MSCPRSHSQHRCQASPSKRTNPPARHIASAASLPPPPSPKVSGMMQEAQGVRYDADDRYDAEAPLSCTAAAHWIAATPCISAAWPLVHPHLQASEPAPKAAPGCAPPLAPPMLLAGSSCSALPVVVAFCNRHTVEHACSQLAFLLDAWL